MQKAKILNDNKLIGDFNGDGRDDYLHVWNLNGKRTFTQYLGNADGTFTQKAYQNTGHNIGSDINGFDQGKKADINGDGKQDYIHIWSENTKRVFGVYLGQTNGSFVCATIRTSHNYWYDYTRHDTGCFLDINGDGRSDYLHYWNESGYKKFFTSFGQATGLLTDGAYTLTGIRY